MAWIKSEDGERYAKRARALKWVPYLILSLSAAVCLILGARYVSAKHAASIFLALGVGMWLGTTRTIPAITVVNSVLTGFLISLPIIFLSDWKTRK